MLGRIINGYTITDFKGKGSFGSVYKCIKNDENYALKIFNVEYVFQEYQLHGDYNRVHREIDALKRVTHPNVTKYIDDGAFQDNEQVYYYVVMEYIEGTTLKDLIDSGKTIGNEELTLNLAKQILMGLKEIHNSGIFHRDLKPENIYISDSNEIKILDFGLAKLIDYTSITETGDRLGSPLYMAPEQIIDSKRVDARTDLYSVGVILFQMLTQNHPYGRLSSREELYYKIINEPPISPSLYLPTISNYLENAILILLNKQNYDRYNNADELLVILHSDDEVTTDVTIKPGYTPTFMLRLYDDKSVLEQFIKDGFEIDMVEFPANLKDRQKGLRKVIKDNDIEFVVDPATMRLAYDTFKGVKGLVSLPYAPEGYDKLDLGDLHSIEKKQSYVKKVLDLEVELGAKILLTPFHLANNSTCMTIKNTQQEDWFAVDIKLIKESWDYNRKEFDGKYPLIAGVAVNSEVLTSKVERDYFLNVLSGLNCNGFLVYVDCVDYKTNQSQLYNYIKTLLLLQDKSRKPVIAGRINTLGLGLLSLGLYAFSGGTARFDSFYEGLWKDEADPYNMYIRYYIPELLINLAVHRKDPQKIVNILKSNEGKHLRCQCPYCKDIKPDQLNDKITKLHFLYRRNEEINIIRQLSKTDRIKWFLSRLDIAEKYYKDLRGIFKPDEYKFLKVWQEVFTDIQKEL